MTKKKWGQHFLKSKSIAESITRTADVKCGDNILEIGPGHGTVSYTHLTLPTICSV